MHAGVADGALNGLEASGGGSRGDPGRVRRRGIGVVLAAHAPILLEPSYAVNPRAFIARCDSDQFELRSLVTARTANAVPTHRIVPAGRAALLVLAFPVV